MFEDDSRANYRVVGPRQWRMIREIPKMDWSLVTGDGDALGEMEFGWNYHFAME